MCRTFGEAVADLIVFYRRLEISQGLVLAKEAELDTSALSLAPVGLLERVKWEKRSREEATLTTGTQIDESLTRLSLKSLPRVLKISVLGTSPFFVRIVSLLRRRSPGSCLHQTEALRGRYQEQLG